MTLWGGGVLTPFYRWDPEAQEGQQGAQAEAARRQPSAGFRDAAVSGARARGAGQAGVWLCVLMRGGVFCLLNLFALQPFSSTCCVLGRVLGAVGVQVYLACVP